jgi:hypothetical protein
VLETGETVSRLLFVERSCATVFDLPRGRVGGGGWCVADVDTIRLGGLVDRTVESTPKPDVIKGCRGGGGGIGFAPGMPGGGGLAEGIDGGGGLVDGGGGRGGGSVTVYDRERAAGLSPVT